MMGGKDMDIIIRALYSLFSHSLNDMPPFAIEPFDVCQ
jgi:hypothetical protein